MTATKLFPWQPWEDEILRGMWPTEPPDIIMMELDSGRSTKAIVQRAFRLGLKKNPASPSPIPPATLAGSTHYRAD